MTVNKRIRVSSARRMIAPAAGVTLLLAGACGTATVTQDAPSPFASAASAPIVPPASGSSAETAVPSSLTSVADGSQLDKGVDLLLSGGERYKRLIKSVVVQVDHRTAAERYAADSGPTVTHNVYSVTKSVMSALIGIAIADGSIAGVDERLADLLPDRVSIMTPEMREVTLREILTMTAGIAGDRASSALYDSDSDWTAVTLSTELVQPPGTGFIYSSAGSHLLSAILIHATHQSVLEYARKRLFDPLGIVTEPASEPSAQTDEAAFDTQPGFGWRVDPTGMHLGYTDLKLTAPDMIKLGQLYLDKGVWRGKQLVPEDWVAASTASQVAADQGLRYGYQWWVTEAHGHPAFAAFGFAGQVVEVVPELNLVVAISCITSADQFQANDLAQLVSTYLAPAVGS